MSRIDLAREELSKIDAYCKVERLNKAKCRLLNKEATLCRDAWLNTDSSRPTCEILRGKKNRLRNRIESLSSKKSLNSSLINLSLLAFGKEKSAEPVGSWLSLLMAIAAFTLFSWITHAPLSAAAFSLAVFILSRLLTELDAFKPVIARVMYLCALIRCR